MSGKGRSGKRNIENGDTKKGKKMKDQSLDKVFGKKIKIKPALKGKAKQWVSQRLLFTDEIYNSEPPDDMKGKLFVYYVKRVEHTDNKFMAEVVYNNKYLDPDGEPKFIAQNRTDVNDDMMHITDEGQIVEAAELFNKYNERALRAHAVKTKKTASKIDEEVKDEDICADIDLSFQNHKKEKLIKLDWELIKDNHAYTNRNGENSVMQVWRHKILTYLTVNCYPQTAGRKSFDTGALGKAYRKLKDNPKNTDEHQAYVCV